MKSFTHKMTIQLFSQYTEYTMFVRKNHLCNNDDGGGESFFF